MSNPAGSSVAAGIYCRISLASDGDTTKTDDQERICRELCQRKGWRVFEVYADHSKSAWQPNRKRPAFDKMLADVEAGLINAIVVYHGDRLYRTHEDLLKLINLARTRGVKLASPVGERDLGNYDDQFVLEIEASVHKRESASTSRRRKAQYARWRLEGKVRPGGRGGRAFGFERDGITHVPAEADAIRDAAQRILLGESTGSAARSFPMKMPSGVPMTDSTLKKVLLRPRTAGLMPDGESTAAWQPVLDRQTWEMVCTVLQVRAASMGWNASNVRRWLLSGIATCGECGKPLRMRQSYGRRGRHPQIQYGCIEPGCPHHVHRAAALLDAYIIGWVITRLGQPDNQYPQLTLDDGATAELAQLEQRRAETEAYIENLADAPGRRLDVLMRALDGFDQKIAELRTRMTGDTSARLRADYAGLTREQWDGLPLDVRRSLVRACCTVTVLRSGQRGPGFHPETVRVDPV